MPDANETVGVDVERATAAVAALDAACKALADLGATEKARGRTTRFIDESIGRIEGIAHVITVLLP